LAGLKRLKTEISPDVICLQEIKVTTELFPYDAITELGYPYHAVVGMKGYNGVAILSRKPLSNISSINWCNKNDCRHIVATIAGDHFKNTSEAVEIHNFYVPAGGDIPNPEKNEKFAHKLQFLEEMTKWCETTKLDTKIATNKTVLVGDLNIAPLKTDVWSHKQLLNVVSHTPIEVEALKKLSSSRPWVDAIRRIIPADQTVFSWWSYRSKDWTVNNRGRRLDHVWVTNSLENAVKNVNVLTEARGWDKPSDHIPITVKLDL